MANKFIVSFGVLCVAAFASACKNPTVSSSSYSTTDGTIVSQVAYIAEFELKCQDGAAGPLFAEYAGRLSPVAVVGPNKYQVSWNEDVKTSSRGEYKVRIFDEESFGAVRKAQRAGDDLNKVKELTTVVVKHPSVFRGPWVNSEFVAISLGVATAYLAFHTRSKIEA